MAGKSQLSEYRGSDGPLEDGQDMGQSSANDSLDWYADIPPRIVHGACNQLCAFDSDALDQTYLVLLR